MYACHGHLRTQDYLTMTRVHKIPYLFIISRGTLLGREMRHKIFSNQCQTEEDRQLQQKARLRHFSLGLIVLREPKKFVLVIRMTCCDLERILMRDIRAVKTLTFG